MRFVQCQAEFRLPAEIGRTSNWDDHSVNSDIFRAYEHKLPVLDQSLSALVEDSTSAASTGTCCFSSAANSAARR